MPLTLCLGPPTILCLLAPPCFPLFVMLLKSMWEQKPSKLFGSLPNQSHLEEDDSNWGTSIELLEQENRNTTYDKQTSSIIVGS